MDVPVRGQRNSQGKSGTLGAVGAGIVFLPLAVIVRGKDVKLPAGTLFEVYFDREVSLGPPPPPDPAVAAPPKGRDTPVGIRRDAPQQAPAYPGGCTTPIERSA